MEGRSWCRGFVGTLSVGISMVAFLWFNPLDEGEVMWIGTLELPVHGAHLDGPAWVWDRHVLRVCSPGTVVILQP